MLHHQSQPSILLIITDQHRHDAMGYTSSIVKTPHLDALAKTSCVFTKAYTQSPQCQPSRASLLTSRHLTCHKVWWNGIKLPAAEVTVANVLSSYGYNTGYFGKAHLVDRTTDDRQVMAHCGFKNHFLFADWVDLGSQPSWDTNKKTTVGRDEYYGIMSQPYWTGRFSRRDVQHEDIITQKAIEFIKKTKSPYFAVVSYMGPHPPYAAPPPFSDMYKPDDMPVWDGSSVSASGHKMSRGDWQDLKSQYYGAISWIDDNIGQLLSHVSHDTIVVFTSDHGDILGDHGLFSKGLYAYDGNTRVPLIIRSPNHDPRSFDGLTQLIDIFPTILDLAELNIPAGIQGRSLVPAIASGTPVNNQALSMIGYQPRLRMIVDEQYKYWIYGDQECLFDLKTDPAENVNITDKAILSQYRHKLLKALIKAEDPLPFPAE